MPGNVGKQIRNRDLYNKREQDTKASENIITPVVIAEGIRTPENLASILRLADAAGIKQVVLVDTGVDIHNKKINRIARDCIKYLQIEHISLDDFVLTVGDYQPLYALEITTESKDLFKSNLTGKFSLVVGSERYGISEKMLGLCSGATHIPMYGRNGSMNVAHALAIALYEWRRQINMKAGD